MQEEAGYLKKQLLGAAEKKGHKETEKYFKKLIELRARQVAVLLAGFREKFGEPDKSFLDFQAEKFYQDCVQIAIAADKLLGIEHDI